MTHTNIKPLLKALGISALVAFLFPFLFISGANAAQIDQSIYEFTLNPEEIKIGSFNYNNQTDEKQVIYIDSFSYDAKNSEILKVDPLINTPDTKLTVEPESSVEIRYAISIPKDQPLGTYFNVISVEPKEGKIGSEKIDVNISKAIGTLFVLNIIDTKGSIEEIFFEQSVTELSISNKGFPLVSPLTAKYTYTNKSDYVFRPEGEIRVIDSEGKQIEQRFEINPNKQTYYPGDTLEFEMEVKTWDTLVHLLTDREVIAHTYSGLGSNYVEDKAVVNIQVPLFASTGIGALAALLILGTSFRIIAKQFKKKD